MSVFLPVVAMVGAVVLQQHPARGAGVPDDEERRVALVAEMERSAVVVVAEMLRPGEPGGGSKRAAIGAGAVLRADGLVVTAAHVVVGADRVAVKVENREPATARVVFLDVASDVALLRLEAAPPGLVPVRLGDSDRVRKGETVYVFGTPAGLERSLSVGVVSGRHPLGHIIGGSIQVEVIQTDAAVNPGSSGGPIFDSRGQLIAIAQLIVSRTGSSSGLGFGLAVNVLKKILALDPCAWLGFSGIPLPGPLAEALNVPRGGGVLVQLVTPGSPAADAGVVAGRLPVRVGDDELLLGGDVVLEAEGVPFMEWVRTRPTGGKLGDRHEFRFLLLRSGRLVELSIAAVHRSAW